MTVISKNGTAFIVSLLLSYPVSAYQINNLTDEQNIQSQAHSHQHSETQPDKREQHSKEATPKEHQDSEGVISLTAAQMAIANIKVETLTAQLLSNKLYAPGEVKANGYTSYLISPRVDSVVIKRHISLGQHVTLGQTLITLFSETVAQAQAQYRTYYADWLRVENLNDTILSEKQKSEAYTRYIAARAILLAYGLQQQDIDFLVNNDSAILGQYKLKAGQNGVILNDDFQQGQRVNAGQALATIVDESHLWVEAKLAPNADVTLPLNGHATLAIDERMYPARIIQQAHTIDPITRTRIIRLSVENSTHDLHAGMFGDVFFETNNQTRVLAVPESALIRRDDGDWTIFTEQASGKFLPVEVTLGRTMGELQEILGVKAGLKIAIQGAFFIASEQAKSSFDPHNH